METLESCLDEKNASSSGYTHGIFEGEDMRIRDKEIHRARKRDEDRLKAKVKAAKALVAQPATTRSRSKKSAS